MYEGGLRVPGLIRWPEQVPPGAVSHAPVNGTDYFPTILEMLDLPLPEDRAIDGQSLMPVLRGEDLPERTLYWRYDGCDAPLKICYREGDWVLVTDAKIDLCELYNLSEDWQQRNNLVYEEFDRFAEMKLRLVELHEAIEEDGPDWWKDNPDPLIPWIRRNPEAITRHLLGKIPEEKPRPYPEAHWPEEGE
jgi:arylsulfatase A